MALLYWLPLISDAHNQGLTGTTFTNNNVTFGGTGKLGTSAVFNGSNGAIYADGMSVGNAWTVCCWAKMANAGTYSLFQLGKSTNYSNSQFYIHTVSGNTKQIYRICNGRESSAITMSVDYTDWVHYCMTYDGTTCTLYINGSKLTDWSVSAALISGTRLTVGACYATTVFSNGMIQDFRLYDDALSPREIAEIAKGLVLHYPLAMPGGANWLYYTNTFQTWPGGSGATVSDGIASIHTSGSDWNGYIRTSGATAQLIPYSSLKDKVITVSVEAKSNVANGRLDICIGSINSSASRLRYRDTWINDIPTEWKRVYLTATLNDSFFIHNTSAAIGDYIGVWFYTYFIDETIQLRRPKLEICDHVTPWVPHTSDSEYSKIGFSDGIEYDVSGYQHNGTKTGTFTYDVSTPRYNTSTVFSGSNHIAVGRLPITDELTYSWWGYVDDWSASKGGAMMCSIEGGGMGHQNGGSSGLWFICGTGISSNNYGSGYEMPVPGAGWHMFTETWDGYRFKVYLDGELKFTNERYTTKTPMYYDAGYNFLFLGGESSSSATIPGDHFVGKLSDARVYATALSAEDVADLYNTSISLSNNGTLMGYEYVEV